MARQLRLQVPGAIYLVSNKTETRNGLFRDDVERQIFLDCLTDSCEKTGWLIHSWALVKDGFFLLVECPEPNLVDGMKWFQGAFTAKVNKLRAKRESLFARRYRSIILDPKDQKILKSSVEYVHASPLFTRSHKGSLSSYNWTSLPLITGSKNKRPGWLSTDLVLSSFGVKDDPIGRKNFLSHLDAMAVKFGSNTVPEPWATDWKSFKRGWFVGSEKFEKELLSQLAKLKEGKTPAKSSSKNCHGEPMARAIVKAGLKALNLKESDLAKMPLGCDEKIVIASVLRQKTTISQDWISQKLKMGHRTNVSNGITRVKTDADGSLTRMVKTVEKSIS